MTLHAIILICSLSTLLHDCTRATALDVLATPAESALPLTCLMLAQQYLAHSAIAEGLYDGSYLKIMCEWPKA
jgi:hypothetical protein